MPSDTEDETGPDEIAELAAFATACGGRTSYIKAMSPAGRVQTNGCYSTARARCASAVPVKCNVIWAAHQVNPKNTPLTSDFVSLHLKGRTDGFALKGGDATKKGAWRTMYDGPRPIKGVSNPNDCHWHGFNGTTSSTYQPMRKQGAIILGTGGDNSNGAVGNFYEGFIATGVTSAETDEKIQANIATVGTLGSSRNPYNIRTNRMPQCG